MCKFDEVFFIDNAHRNSSSASSSHFEIDLPHPVFLDDTNGVAIKSLTCTNTVKTVNQQVNDALFFRLGFLDRLVILNPQQYDASNASNLITDLQAKVNALFPVTPNIHNAAGVWTRSDATSSTDTWAPVSGNPYQYTYHETTGRTATFTGFDVNDGSAVFTDTDGTTTHTYTYNIDTNRFESPMTSWDWIPPATFYWEGIYNPGSTPPSNLISVALSGTQLVIQPTQTHGLLRIFTDYQVRHTAGFNPIGQTIFGQAVVITKDNLRSANRVITNLTNETVPYQTSFHFNRPLEYHPIKSIFLATDIPLSSHSSGGPANLLKHISIKPNVGIVYRDDVETHAVDIKGQNAITKLTFKLCDIHGNVIDLEGKLLSFGLVIKS